MLPPGRCRLVTGALLIGSEPPTKPIGIGVVAALGARADVSPAIVTMTATWSHQISGDSRESIVLTLSPTIVEGHVLPLDKARLIESLADDCNERSINSRRTAAE